MPTAPTVPSRPEEDLLDLYRRHLSRGRALFGQVSGALTEVSSAGARVRTADGRDLLDLGGYGVFLHGHCHPDVVEAVVAQARSHPLATRVLLDPVTAAAARDLARVSPPGLEHVHFVNSGAEATETALKLARALGCDRLIATRGGFHGKTMGALSLTGNPLYQNPFRPMLSGVEHVPYGDVEALSRALAAGPGRACLVLEPVQGEAGVIFPPPGYLAAAQRLCREHGALFVVDEIQTGLGRTGYWWGGDVEDLRPDLMLVGKGLSGGVVPVAAVVATDAAYAPFDADPYLHSSTFAGSPLACAAASAAIAAIERYDLTGAAARLGENLLGGVREVVGRRVGTAARVRGRGLLIGIEFASAGSVGELVLALLREGVLVSTSLNAHRVLRLTPPAVMTDAEVDEALGALDRAMTGLG